MTSMNSNPEPAYFDASAARGLHAELSQTVDRAHQERLRLLRLIREFESRLSEVGTPIPAAKLQKLADRIATLDDAITRRLSELDGQESASDNRRRDIEGLLEAAELARDSLAEAEKAHREIHARTTSLQSDIDKQISDGNDRLTERARDLARPFQEAMAEEQKRASESLRVDLDRATRPLAERIMQMIGLAEQKLDEQAGIFDQKLTQILETRAAEQQERINQQFAELGKALDERFASAAGKVREQAVSIIEQSSAEMEEQLERFATTIKDRSSNQIEQTRTALVEDADASTKKIQERMQSQIESTADGAQGRADGLIHKAQQNAETQLRAMDQAVEDRHQQIIRRIEQSRAEQEAILKTVADRAEADLRNALVNVSDKIRREADEAIAALDRETSQKTNDMLSGYREQSADTLASLRAKADEAVEPITRLCADRVREMREQISAVFEGEQSSMQQRMSELRESSHAMISLIESQLRRRVEGVRPALSTELAQAQQAIEQKLAQAEAQADAMIESSDQRIAERLSNLRPQLHKLTQEADQSVREALARVRQAADQAPWPAIARVAAENVSDALPAMAQKVGMAPQQSAPKTEAA
ncbi:MAG: hypothetical protein RLN76_13240 [Phycisphaeraceae bacterium]